jgi:hypothetical protein
VTELQRALADLGAHLDVPDAPDLPARVAFAVRTQASPRPAGPRRRRLAVAVAALATIVAGAASAPAVASWLGVRGVVIKEVQGPVAAPIPTTAPPSPTQAPTTLPPLDLGRPMTMEDAAEAAGFELLVPAGMGAPDEAWFDDVAGVPVVSLVYHPRSGLPATGTTGVGALVTELRAPLDEEATLTKQVTADTVVEAVTVAGGRGLWVEGIHAVMYAMPEGDIAVDQLRLADRVLLWERGDITLRLETALDRDAAIRLAETVG